MNKPSIGDIKKLPVEIIQNFRETGKSAVIHKKVQQYILHLDRAAEIVMNQNEHNISRAAKLLRETFPEISYSCARDRVYDAISYFHINKNMSEASWNHYYADRMEDLAKLAISDNNLTEARRCTERAEQYRMKAAVSNVDPNDIKPHTFRITTEVTHELLGIEKKNKREMWPETREFIKKMDIDKAEKARLAHEATQNLGEELKNEDIEYLEGENADD